MRMTATAFRAAKGQKKLAMLTCYDYTMANLIDASGVDAILVGDSLGMVMLGYPDTVSVTMEEMIHHCAAVSRACRNTLLICDMPYMSSQCGVYETVRNAGRLLKEGHAQAVKMEGGAEFSPEIAALAKASIPVMAHIGLTPQSVHSLGGYKVQGRAEKDAQKLLDAARALEDAGAFALLLECVPWQLAQKITASVSIPTIGIGAGEYCDGQVLVWQDMLGLSGEKLPKFVHRFADARSLLEKAFADYVHAVQTGTFPGEEHSYCMDNEIIEKLY